MKSLFCMAESVLGEYQKLSNSHYLFLACSTITEKNILTNSTKINAYIIVAKHICYSIFLTANPWFNEVQ